MNSTFLAAREAAHDRVHFLCAHAARICASCDCNDRVRALFVHTALASFALAALFFLLPCKVYASEGINVEYHTIEEVRMRVAYDSIALGEPVQYAEEPLLTEPYRPGTLDASTLDTALRMLNQIRYIAGIPDNVRLNAEYSSLCQAACIVNYANDSMTHYPVQPAGMDETLYNRGAQGASESNIAAGWGSKKITCSLPKILVTQWMEDADSSNVAEVGHRRWCLNPSMTATGFGAVTDGKRYQTAMYAFDNSFGGTPFYGVAWPAQSMPVSYFGSDYPWSISMGYSLDEADIEVTLTRESDGHEWYFSANDSDGTFYVNNGNYGRQGCIIFRPLAISYKAGDRFNVSITGTQKPVSYTVEFFDIAEISPQLVCDHVWMESGRTEPTCQSVGSINYICTLCGETKSDALPKIDHDYEQTDYTEGDCVTPSVTTYTCTMCKKSYTEEGPYGDHDYEPVPEMRAEPTCTESGHTVMQCVICGDTIEESLPPLGHDWSETYTQLRPSSCTVYGREARICNRCGELADERAIPLKPHESDGVVHIDTPSTTFRNGTGHYECANCHTRMESVTIESRLPHWSLYVFILLGIVLGAVIALVAAVLIIRQRHRKRKRR